MMRKTISSSKMLQYFGRGIRCFSISSSSAASSSASASIMKQAWDEQKASRLFWAFTSGFVAHVYTHYRKRKAFYDKLDEMHEDYLKRDKEVSDKYLRPGSFWRS